MTRSTFRTGGGPLSTAASAPSNSRSSLLAMLLGLACAVTPPVAAGAQAQEPAASCPGGGAPASLEHVLERVRQSPRVEAAAAELAALDALVEQAGALPNPVLAVEVEDFTGSGAYSEFGQTQATVGLAQRIELGGVRARRVEVAAREGLAGKARRDQEALQLAMTVKQRFVELVVARERLRVVAESEGLAREVLADAQRRTAAGAAPAADAERAGIAIATAALNVAETRRESITAAQRLVALWGGDAAEAGCVLEAFRRAAPSLPTPAPVASGGRSDAGMSPSVAIAEAEVDIRRAEAEFARASATPELEVGAGVRYLAGTDDVTAVAGMRVEVPIFDRNAGAITAAERTLGAAQARARAGRIEAGARLARLRSALQASAERASALSQTMLPSAERAFGLLSNAWRSGTVPAHEVLDARRTLLELRLQHLDALAEFHTVLASYEAATGNVPARLAPTLPSPPSAHAAGSARPETTTPGPTSAPAGAVVED